MTENEVAKNAYVSEYNTAWADTPPHVQKLWLSAWHAAAYRPPVLPDTTEQILRDEASGYDAKGLCYVRAGLMTEAADLICALATDSGRFQSSCDELRQRVAVLVKFVESLEFEQGDELPDDVWSIVQHWPGLVPLPNVEVTGTAAALSPQGPRGPQG